MSTRKKSTGPTPKGSNPTLKRLSGAKPKAKAGKRAPRGPKTVTVKSLTGPELRAALADILGATPKEIIIKLDDKLGPGGARIMADEPQWSGNIYKYRY